VRCEWLLFVRPEREIFGQVDRARYTLAGECRGLKHIATGYFLLLVQSGSALIFIGVSLPYW
jgi:hypothetical protein